MKIYGNKRKYVEACEICGKIWKLNGNNEKTGLPESQFFIHPLYCVQETLFQNMKENIGFAKFFIKIQLLSSHMIWFRNYKKIRLH